MEGANKYRNPDDDLPKDFEEKREEYYKALSLPEEAKAFVASLQAEMITALESFDRALPKLAPKVRRSTEEVVRLLRGPRLLRHKSSMTSPRGWEQQINRLPSAGRSSGSGW